MTIIADLLARPGLQITPDLSKHMAELIEKVGAAIKLDDLDGAKPILLLPLRLETRFRGKSLWIRAFPDVISIDQHQPLLTEQEQNDGKAFVDRTGADPDGAWAALTAARSPERAAYVAKACDAAVGGGESERAANPIAQPVACALPERLAFVLVSASNDPDTGLPKVRTVLGAPIPDDLPVGPDPANPPASLFSDAETKRLDLVGDLEWLASPEAARKVGMAVEIADLEDFELKAGFASVTVLGVRQGEDAFAQAERLRQLLDAHRYTDGFSLVRQGEQTNSSAEPGAARPAPSPLAPVPEIGDPAKPRFYDLESDGDRLAHALGLPLEAVAGVDGADGQDGAEAIAMGRALWSSTLGNFLTTMVDPLLKRATLDRARDFFTYHVGSPLPAVRVGDQPYGILPATRFAGLQFARRDWTFQTGLQSLLWSAKRAWDGRTDELSHVGADNDPDATLLGILRQYPSSVRFAQTRLVGPDFREAALRLQKVDAEQIRWDIGNAGIAAAIAAEQANNLAPGDPFNPLMKIFQLAERWRSDLKPMLAGAAVEERVPLSESVPLGALGSTGGNYIEWLMTADPADVIAERIVGADGAAVAPPRALLYMLLRQAWQLEHAVGSARATSQGSDSHVSQLIGELETVNIGKAAVPRFVEVLGAPIGMKANPEANLVTFMAEPKNRPAIGKVDVGYRQDWAKISDAVEVGSLLPELIGSIGVRQYFDGLSRLAGLPTARLERLFADRIDACAYRIDAWMTGLVSLKLLSLRSGEDVRRLSATPLSYEKARGGIYLGAYGRLEHLTPRARSKPRGDALPEALREGGAEIWIDPASQGYVHAPSLDHAATAAILKSGERSHRQAGASPFRVNLSSRRVRLATWLCEGLRNGQPLGALLGYLFERALHDNPGDLDQYLLAVRLAFPTYVEAAAEQLEGVPIEDDAPRNVVDGLKMVEARAAGSLAGLLTAAVPDAADRAILSAIVDDLADAVDAVGDLTLAESVHQFASGNIERAAGVIDAAAKATHVPQQFDVAETPITGRSLTHRIGLLFDGAAESSSPWTGAVPVTPRGALDPVLNRWIGEVLGDPATVGARVGLMIGEAASSEDVALSELTLEPVDLLLMLSDGNGQGLSELAARFAHRALARRGDPAGQVRAVDLDQADGLTPIADWMLLAESLRGMLLGRRPLGARDFALPGTIATDAPDRHDVVELAARCDALLAGLKTAVDKLQAALDAHDPAAMTEAREALALFGMPDALPPLPGQPAGDALAAGQALLTSVKARIVRASAMTADPALAGDALAAALTNALRALLGGVALVAPLFQVASPDLQAQVAGGGIAPALNAGVAMDPVESWLLGLSVVRPPIAAMLDARLAGASDAAFGERPAIWQLPGETPWCALAWDADSAPPEFGAVAAMAMLCPNPVGSAGPWRGLLIDSWVETVPDAVQTTGLAFHFDAPASEPPQALILAVAPGPQWSWSDLLGTVEETFDAARRRLVVPSSREDAEEDPDAEYDAASMIAPLLPAIVSPLSARPTSIALDYLALSTHAAAVSVAQFKDLL